MVSRDIQLEAYGMSTILGWVGFDHCDYMVMWGGGFISHCVLDAGAWGTLVFGGAALIVVLVWHRRDKRRHVEETPDADS